MKFRVDFISVNQKHLVSPGGVGVGVASYFLCRWRRVLAGYPPPTPMIQEGKPGGCGAGERRVGCPGPPAPRVLIPACRREELRSHRPGQLPAAASADTHGPFDPSSPNEQRGAGRQWLGGCALPAAARGRRRRPTLHLLRNVLHRWLGHVCATGGRPAGGCLELAEGAWGCDCASPGSLEADSRIRKVDGPWVTELGLQ